MNSRKSELSRIRSGFYFDDKGKPDIYRYGTYRLGVTNEEIDEYLAVRAGTIRIERIKKRFWDLFGCGTAPLVVCPECKKQICLIYRSDVERFSDVIFENKPTYFD